jgi:methyl-accepting chemotaxis protein
LNHLANTVRPAQNSRTAPPEKVVVNLKFRPKLSERIPDTNLKQYGNHALDFLERHLPALQEPILTLDTAVVFAAAVDRNLYLPVHNGKYSEPQGADPEWNNAHSRNRRIFDDMTGLMAGRNTRKILSQTYPRDRGGGRLELIKDISAPIYVNGKHWGGLRLGARIS